MHPRSNRILLSLGFIFSWAFSINAQEIRDPVVATVGDRALVRTQIDQVYHQKFASRGIGESLKASLRGQILDQIIRQQMVLEKLAGTDLRATSDEIDLEISRIRKELSSRGKNLEEQLKERHSSMSALRFNLDWQISWLRYLERTLTDDVLQNYFKKHRRRFDGTEIRVAHCFFPIDPNTEEQGNSLSKVAQLLREQIEQGEIRFEEAVLNHSSAPSKSQKGDLGWIQYAGPMSRTFTEAAWDLSPGEISKPVKTPQGIHLIKCLEIREGVRPWYDAKSEIRKAATEDLFEMIADRQAAKTEVQIIEP